MNRGLSFGVAILVSILSLAACSGVPQGGGGGNPTDATLSLTLGDTPPANASIISFNLPVHGITITPTTGSAQTLLSSTATFDVVPLQSDSALIGTFSVPAGQYSKITVVLDPPSGTFLNSSGSAIGSCPASTVCSLPTGALASIDIPLTSFTLTSAQSTGLRLDFNLNNAITTTGGISVDFSQPNVLTALTLPRTGQATGTLDTIEDFTGVVQTISGNSITIQSGTRGSITVIKNSSTTFDDPQNLCTVSAGTCLATGQIVSADASLLPDGTLSLLELDFLGLSSRDELEGTLFQTGVANQFGLVLFDKTVATTSNSTLSGLKAGDTVLVNMNSPLFAIDTKGLAVNNPAAFSSSASLLEGQTVRVHATSATTVSNQATVATDSVLLRFSRLTGTVGTVSGTTFDIGGMPSLYQDNFVGTAQVQVFANTTFDGVANIGGLSNGQQVSVRALLLKAAPAFAAAKVRLQQ